MRRGCWNEHGIPTWTLVLASLLVGVTAGCGGDADQSDSDRTTSTVEVPHQRTADELAADQADAEAIVLTLDDLDPGWEASPTGDEGDDAGDVETLELADCLGVDVSQLQTDDPFAESSTFTSSDDEEVSASVEYAESVEAAEGLMELQRDEDVPSCFVEMMSHLLQDPTDAEPVPEAVEFGEPTFNPISFAEVGEDTVAYRITIPVSVSGVEVSMYLDLVSVRTGRVVISGSFRSPFAPFSSHEAEQLLGSMIERVPPETWSQLV